MTRSLLVLTISLLLGMGIPVNAAVQTLATEFNKNIIGPEILLPLNERGFIRLSWKPFKPKTRFLLKSYEKPIYRIYVACEDEPAENGRIYVTYDTSYPLTNLKAKNKFHIKVDVEQNGQEVLKERTYIAKPIIGNVRWYAAPKAAGGNYGNPGTYNKPVDTAYINEKAGPGDIVILKSGVYFSPSNNIDRARHDHKLTIVRGGGPGAHVLILAEANDISQAKYVSFQTAWGNISINKSDYVLFDGINCDSDQGLNSKALTSILGEYGHRPYGIIVRNAYYRTPTADKHIMVNGSKEVIIENCFFPGSTESHNVYICNNTQNRPEYSDSRAIFRNCISMNSTRNNIHANGFFDNFIIENNIFVGAKVANISLATVHRNSHVRNNIAYSGAKQALTLNFYQNMPGVPLEDRQQSSNIQINHNTFVLPGNTSNTFAAIIISDKRRMPLRHTVKDLDIKNNLFVTHKESSENMLLNLQQSRHLSQMEVKGNLFYAKGNQWGYHGEVKMPGMPGNEKGIYPVKVLEESSHKSKPITVMDCFRDEKDNKQYQQIKVRLREWSKNKIIPDVNALFINESERDYRLKKDSPAIGGGIFDQSSSRIKRDIYGNIRFQKKDKIDIGAVVGGSKNEVTTDISQYELNYPVKIPVSEIKVGKRTLVASAIIKVKSNYNTTLRYMINEIVVNKMNKNDVIDINNTIIADLVINKQTRKIIFNKQDQAGYEKFWLHGKVNNINISAKGNESLDVNIYITITHPGQIQSISAGFAHDNIWGYDSVGRKIALTGLNEFGFNQVVVPQ